MPQISRNLCALPLAIALLAGCQQSSQTGNSQTTAQADAAKRPDTDYLSQPLVKDIYTADPSAHVWDGKIYVYPSHDIDGPAVEDDLGSHFEMRDYRVLRMDKIGGPVTVGPVALDVKGRTLGSQADVGARCREKGRHILSLLPRQGQGRRLPHWRRHRKRPDGSLQGPAKADQGQLFHRPPQSSRTRTGRATCISVAFGAASFSVMPPANMIRMGPRPTLARTTRPALAPRVAKMSGDMLEFAETPREIQIVDDKGKPLLGGDHDRRFFEAAWMHKYKGKYYFSYSTGDTHYLAYGIGDSPYGPFTYKGRILEPVEGWTTHHSIVEWGGKWWLFYADSQLSGQTRLRNVKVTELKYNPDGTIQTINPFVAKNTKESAAK